MSDGDDNDSWPDIDDDDETYGADDDRGWNEDTVDDSFDRENENEGRATQLIDDHGNLFGVVNVIDALVVLLTLAVVVAGISLVFGGAIGGGGGLETTYATLDLGTQPDEVVTALNEGDTHTADSVAGNLTITDLYTVPDGNQPRAIARVRIEGTLGDEALTYDGAPLRLGRSLTIATNRYEVSGSIRGVGNASTLNIAQTDLVVEDTIDVEDAEQLTVGDEIRIDRRTIGTVESVNQYGTGSPNRVQVVVGLSVATLRDGDTLRYGLTPVERGSRILLPADEYDINGQIIAVGTSEPPGTATDRTVTLRLSEVRDTIADSYQPGMTEMTGGETVAEVTAVDVRPSTVVTTAESGAVKANDHPINRDVTMTAELSVRETPSGIQFKGDPLRQGNRITLDVGSTTIRPTVESIR